MVFLFLVNNVVVYVFLSTVWWFIYFFGQMRRFMLGVDMGPVQPANPVNPEPAHISRFVPVHRFDSGKKTKEPNKSGSGVGFQIS